MLGAAAAHNILRDWTTYIVAFSGVGLTWGTAYIRVIYPRSQAHKQHEAERQRLRDENAALNAGLKELPQQVGLILLWIAEHEKETGSGPH